MCNHIYEIRGCRGDGKGGGVVRFLGVEVDDILSWVPIVMVSLLIRGFG